MTKRNRYTPQQRELAVKMVLTQQKKCKERKDRYGIIPNVAKNLGIPVNTLKCWIKRAKKQTPPQKRGRPSLLSDTEMLVLKAFLNKCAEHDFAVTKPVMVEFIRKLTDNRITVSTAKESRWLSRVLNRLNWNFKKQSYQYIQPSQQENSNSSSNSGDSQQSASSSANSSPISPSTFSVPSSTTPSPLSSPSPLMSLQTNSNNEASASSNSKIEEQDPSQLSLTFSMLSQGLEPNHLNNGENEQGDKNKKEINGNHSRDDEIEAMASISANPQLTVDSEEIRMRADQLFWDITETKREFWKLGDLESAHLTNPLGMQQTLPQSSLLSTSPTPLQSQQNQPQQQPHQHQHPQQSKNQPSQHSNQQQESQSHPHIQIPPHLQQQLQQQQQQPATGLDGFGFPYHQDQAQPPFMMPLKSEEPLQQPQLQPQTHQHHQQQQQQQQQPYFNPMNMPTFNSTQPNMHPFNQPLQLFYTQCMYPQPYMWSMQQQGDQHPEQSPATGQLDPTSLSSSITSNSNSESFGLNTT